MYSSDSIREKGHYFQLIFFSLLEYMGANPFPSTELDRKQIKPLSRVIHFTEYGFIGYLAWQINTVHFTEYLALLCDPFYEYGLERVLSMADKSILQSTLHYFVIHFTSTDLKGYLAWQINPFYRVPCNAQ
jgi:hypothetical protein